MGAPETAEQYSAVLSVYLQLSGFLAGAVLSAVLGPLIAWSLTDLSVIYIDYRRGKHANQVRPVSNQT